MSVKKKGIDFMIDLFDATRNHIKFSEVIIPLSLFLYASKIYSTYNQPTALVIPEGELIQTQKLISKKGIFTLSGGKDSLAVFLKNRNKFSEVKCFYVRGITPYVKDSEFHRAKKISEILNVTLEEIILDFNTYTSLPESVIKNQMIYAIIMDKLDSTPLAIGFGGTNELGPQSMCFYHDHPDAFKLFHQFAIQSWGEHNLIPFVKDELESYSIIYELAPRLVNMISSCMTPADKKDEVREWIQKEFGIELENEYQCGACYKCAEEQIIAKRFYNRIIPEKYNLFCQSVIIDKCLFEKHNLNGFVPANYLAKLGINSVRELLIKE